MCPIPEGWTVSKSSSRKAFKFFSLPSNFVGALNKCNEYGGRLAMANTDEELVQLNEMSKSVPRYAGKK